MQLLPLYIRQVDLLQTYQVVPSCVFFCGEGFDGIAYLKREKRPSEMLHMAGLELKCDSRIHHIMFADWRPSQVCEHLLNEAYRILRLIVVRYVLPNSARSSDPHSFWYKKRFRRVRFLESTKSCRATLVFVVHATSEQTEKMHRCVFSLGCMFGRLQHWVLLCFTTVYKVRLSNQWSVRVGLGVVFVLRVCYVWVRFWQIEVKFGIALW